MNNSQFIMHNFGANRMQTRIYSQYAEVQPKVSAALTMHNEGLINFGLSGDKRI